MIIEERESCTFIDGKPRCGTCKYFMGIKESYIDENPEQRVFKCKLDLGYHTLTEKGTPYHHCALYLTYGRCFTCVHYRDGICYAGEYNIDKEAGSMCSSKNPITGIDNYKRR